jgi:hypothetical protein
MAKVACCNNNRNFYIIMIFIALFLIYIFASYYLQNQCINCNLEKDKMINNVNNKIDKIENKLENYENNIQPIVQPPQLQYVTNYPNAVVQQDPKTMNALDRIYNPLRYPEKSPYFYDQAWYPSLDLGFEVIGAGSRRSPALGGTQIPIYNAPVPIDISNDNIAPSNIRLPVNYSTRGPSGVPQQVGVIYKIFGNGENQYLPLFGKRRYPNDNRYDYYTILGNYNVKVPIITKNKYDELGNNDRVFVKGDPSVYTVTLYSDDTPQYIPYI